MEPVATAAVDELVTTPDIDSGTLAALARLDMRAARSGAQLVISTTVEALDDVFACCDRSDPQILVDPTRAERVIALGRVLAKVPNLRLRGLMGIPEQATDPAQQRAAFARLRQLHGGLRADGLAIDTLSMGMSGDMTAAIAEGATIVRIGSAIFGARNYD